MKNLEEIPDLQNFGKSQSDWTGNHRWVGRNCAMLVRLRFIVLDPSVCITLVIVTNDSGSVHVEERGVFTNAGLKHGPALQ